ncbi:MAG: hypothetical protein ACRC7O_01500, partial [Fimbriiglobus sp.]
MSKEITYHHHTVAAMFPRHNPDEDASLERSIRESGVHTPLVLWKDPKGKVWLIDGLTREEISQRLLKEGVTKAANGASIALTPDKFVYFEGTPATVVSFIEGLNLSRRNLNSAQRAAIGVQTYKKFVRELAIEQGVPQEEVNTGETGET